MFQLLPPLGIAIRESPIPHAGRGVFATRDIRKGALIEQCPVIVLEPGARNLLRKTGLVNYYFLWRAEILHVAICLGWGSVYNHSYTPNAQFTYLPDAQRMDFHALRDIAADEEILVNYNGSPSDATPLRIPGIRQAEGTMPHGWRRYRDGMLRRVRLAISLEWMR